MPRKLKPRKPATRKRDAWNKVYFKSLDDVIDRLFNVAYTNHLSWAQMADMSGLSPETICKLGNRETNYPQFRTIEMLARGLGGRLAFTEGTHRNTVSIKWKPIDFYGRRKKLKVA